jgi:hypothetical protein
MAYVCEDPDAWNGKPMVGTGQCVEFVKAAAHAPETGLWTEGTLVKGDRTLASGTAIATFINGIYPSLSTGNHAAIYLSQDKFGLWVIDQYKSKPEQKVSKRFIRFKGGVGSRSNDGDAYAVIR